LDKELKFSDPHEGDELSSLVKHIRQEDINRYAEASGDFNPIHIDEDFAAQTPLMLVLAYVSEMMTAAFGENWLSGGKLSVRFKAPARPEDIITVTGKIDSIEYKESIPYVNCGVETLNQNGETIVTGKATVRFCS